MTDMDDYLAADATELARRVRDGAVKPDELRELATVRHRATHPTIHAVVEWYEDVGRGSTDGPLAGVPFLRKDYGSTESGRLVEMGSRLAAGVTADVTSPFFARLAAAGAQVLGRTAVPELIQHGTTESIAFGATHNPHDPTLSAGGSSGGAGAAVAAGVVPAAHASDCAGSIRIPAAACGLFGLKPSRRRVPWPEGGWGGIAEEFVVTRSARDARLFLDVLGDGDYLAVPDRQRIALDTSHWAGSEPDPVVVEAVERSAQVLADAGHVVEIVDTPVPDERLVSTWIALFWRWVARDVARLAALTGRPVDGTMLEPTTLIAVDAVAHLTVDDVTDAQITQGLVTHDLHQRLRGFDAFLTPTLGRATIPLDSVHGLVTPFDTYLERTAVLFPYNYLFNVTGWASIAVPVDTPSSPEPLATPSSVQLSGPIGSENRLLALAETLSPGVRPPA